MAVSIFLRLRLALVLLIGACRPDPSPQAPTAPVGGTYRVIFTTDSSQVTAQLEIQSAADSVTWGQLTYPDSDREGVVLDSVSGDSLYLRLGFTGLMVLARGGDTLRGSYYGRQDTQALVWQPMADTVSPRLQRLIANVPLTILGPDGRRLERVRWPAPLAADRFYFSDLSRWPEGGIMLARPEGDHWRAELVAGQAGYRLGAPFAAPEGRFLVAQGSPLDSTRPGIGASDVYRLDLNAAGDSITEVALLPRPINGPSFDNFPSLRGDSVLLYSPWNRPEDQGRGDLHEAPLSGPPYQTYPYAGGALNTPEVESGPYEDPQQRFLLYFRSSRAEGYPDLMYIAVREGDEWGAPQRMGELVNGGLYAFGGRVDPTGTYFYWNGGHRIYSQVYRVPVEEVPALRPFFAPPETQEEK